MDLSREEVAELVARLTEAESFREQDSVGLQIAAQLLRTMDALKAAEDKLNPDHPSCLEGYRELGRTCAALEARAEKAEAALGEQYREGFKDGQMAQAKHDGVDYVRGRAAERDRLNARLHEPVEPNES